MARLCRLNRCKWCNNVVGRAVISGVFGMKFSETSRFELMVYAIGGGAGGSCPSPLADKDGQTVSNAPPPRISQTYRNDTCKHGKTYAYDAKMCKILPKCVKFACNYTLKILQLPGVSPPGFRWGYSRPTDPLWFCPHPKHPSAAFGVCVFEAIYVG